MWFTIHLMNRFFWMELSMLRVLLIKCVVHGMLMEVDWFDIMLVIKSVIKHVVVLMDFVFTLLMLMANLGIMRGILVA